MRKRERKELNKLFKKRNHIRRQIEKLTGFDPFCVDCRVDTHHIQESYMVHDRVWKKAGMKPDGGRLCVGCIERRLGRKLNCNDFFLIGLNIDAYIYPWAASRRLRKRLHDYGQKGRKI